MAVDNFVAFKKLMVKRNSELNQQVLAADKATKEDTTTTPLQQPADPKTP
jgi:hypothetical protein